MIDVVHVITLGAVGPERDAIKRSSSSAVSKEAKDAYHLVAQSQG